MSVYWHAHEYYNIIRVYVAAMRANEEIHRYTPVLDKDTFLQSPMVQVLRHSCCVFALVLGGSISSTIYFHLQPSSHRAQTSQMRITC